MTQDREAAVNVTLNDLWAEMWEDLRHNATGKPSGAAIIANWRVVIEGAIRGQTLAATPPVAETGGLDVERLARALLHVSYECDDDRNLPLSDMTAAEYDRLGARDE